MNRELNSAIQRSARPLLSIVMPCLNEERTLDRCISAAQHGIEMAGVSGEVIIADNGSTDSSTTIALRKQVRLVHVTRKGYGAALKAGIAAAEGAWVLIGDADDSYDFEEIPKFVLKLNEGYDLVVGNRFKGGILPGAMPWHHRYIGNPVLSGLGRLLFPSNCGDYHCGLRAFCKSSISSLSLSCDGMEFASEMIALASLKGLSITEIPVILRPDGRDRKPHLRSFRDGLRHLLTLTYIAANRKRVKTEIITKRQCSVPSIWTVFIFCSLAVMGCSSQTGVFIDPSDVTTKQMKVDETYIHTFTVHNHLSDPINIESITPSCRCISLKVLEGDPQLPIEYDGHLTLQASVKVFGGSAIQRGSVTITGRSQQDIFELNTKFAIPVEAKVSVSPESFNFGSSENEMTKAHSLDIVFSKEDTPPKVYKATTSSKEIELLETKANAVIFRLKRSDFDTGRDRKEYIYLEAGESPVTKIAVPVSWRQESDVSYSPKLIAIVKPEKPHNVTIESRRPVKISAVNIPEGLIQITDKVKGAEYANSHTICMQSPNQKELSKLSAKGGEGVQIQLVYEDNAQVTLNIPVYKF